MTPEEQIKKLKAELAKTKKAKDAVVRELNASKVNTLRESYIKCSIEMGMTGVMSDLGSGLADEYYHDGCSPEQQKRLLQKAFDLIGLLTAFTDRVSTQSIHSAQIIDV